MIPTTVGSVVAGRDMGFVAGRDMGFVASRDMGFVAGRDAIFRFSAEKKKANL